MLSSSTLALIITFAVALLFLRLNDFAAHRGWISSQLSRKIIHMGTGPIFVLCWLLFPGNPADRYLAANPREILKGPLFYGIIFIVLTIVYWMDSPIGIIGLMLMCGGDGLADILGRRFGKVKLPWAKEKSWVGSLGMLAGGWVFAIGIMMVYLSKGIFPGSIDQFLIPLTVIALAGTIVESLPLRNIDNITVTLTAIILGHIFI